MLDALSIDRCAWIGLSWGGMVGMRLGLRIPERLAGLALFDTNANSESRRKVPSYLVMAAIARRFDAMLDAGLVDEVRQLRERHALTANLPSMRCVGYRQTLDYLDGRIARDALRERGIAATRQPYSPTDPR